MVLLREGEADLRLGEADRQWLGVLVCPGEFEGQPDPSEPAIPGGFWNRYPVEGDRVAFRQFQLHTLPRKRPFLAGAHREYDGHCAWWSFNNLDGVDPEGHAVFGVGAVDRDGGFVEKDVEEWRYTQDAQGDADDDAEDGGPAEEAPAFLPNALLGGDGDAAAGRFGHAGLADAGGEDAAEVEPGAEQVALVGGEEGEEAA